MTAAVTETRGPGRPAVEPERAESDRLRRIADLAAAIMRVLRTDGHARFPSERALKNWMTEQGVPFSSDDVPAALSLLSALNLITRDDAGLGQARGGRLVSADDDDDVEPRGTFLAKLIIELCRAGNGRDRHVTVDQIRSRAEAADEDISDVELNATLERLCDTEFLIRTQKSSGYPMAYVESSKWTWGIEDELEADIGAVAKTRAFEGWADVDELKVAVGDAGIVFTEGSFQRAVGHLGQIGRLQRPRPIRGGEPRLFWFDPETHRE